MRAAEPGGEEPVPAGQPPAGQPSAGHARAGQGRPQPGASRWADLGGPVHYLDFGGPAGGPVIVGVHGLDGCAVNWSAIAPLLTGRYRVLALDLAGHGLTRSAGRSTSVPANQALLHRFVETVPGTPVILMGNSMGGMISLLEASAAPGTVTSLILVDPVLPAGPGWPGAELAGLFTLFAMPWLDQLLMSRRLWQPPEAIVAWLFSLCCADPSAVSPDVVAQHVEVARQRAEFADADRDLSTAMRSVAITAGYGTGAGYRRAARSVDCPVLLLHGREDRLVPVSAARAAARAYPGWTLVELPGAGHVPQLEAPAECVRAISAWLGPLAG